MENEVKIKKENEQQQILELFKLVKKLVGENPWRFCKYQETDNGRITLYLKVIDKKQ